MSRSLGIARRIFAATARIGLARRLLFRGFDWAMRRRQPWLAFDRDLGIDTRGFLPAHALRSGTSSDAFITAYGGAMPSVVRRALALLPDPSAAHFLDLGAGKGRALAVAGELPFRSLTGIEINPDLCAIARRNAAAIARRHPKRTAITIVEGDASRPTVPAEGTIVAFLYHSFGPALVSTLADHLAVAAGDRPLLLIYLNPVHGDILDAHPAFTRWHAEQAPYSPEEREAGDGGVNDALVLWQAGTHLPPHEGADRAILITTPDWRSDLAP